MLIGDSWVHLQPSLVQNSILLLQMRSHFGKIVQTFELKRVRGAPKGHQLTPLDLNKCHSLKLLDFTMLLKAKVKQQFSYNFKIFPIFTLFTGNLV